MNIQNRKTHRNSGREITISIFNFIENQNLLIIEGGK